MKVIIDGVEYVPAQQENKKVAKLLCEIYGNLWTEAYYDPLNEATKMFAHPLAKKMAELNDILKFRE